MKILLSYLKKYKYLVLLSLLLATVNQVFSLMDPMIMGRLINKFATHRDDFQQADYIKGVLLLLGAAVGVAMISRIAKAFQDYFQSVVIQKFGADVYTDGLKHTLRLPYQDFEDQRSGETLNVLQKVRIDSEKFILNFINVLFFSVVGIIFVMVYAFTLYPALIAIYVVAAVLLSGITYFLSKRIKAVQTKIVKQTNLLAGTTTESLRNIELVKSLGLSGQEMKRLQLATMKILQLEIQKVSKIRSISFIQGSFVNLLRQTILFVLLWLVFRHTLNVGDIFTMQIYSFFIFNPLQEMGNVILSYREAEASLNNFQNILKKPVEKTPDNPEDFGAVAEIDFDKVSFKHRSGNHYAIEDITFNVKKGESIAFVGPSGAGKSTLVKLLVGLYLPEIGSITCNGHELHNINIDLLRKQIGFVTQDTQLFAGTIKENLQFVAPGASDEEMLDMLNKAACQNLLARSEQGIYSIIGEGGMKVSGGEKQRLSIARALLRKPNLLVFDEATSALDSMTEAEITQTIKNITATKEHITVMIAHRLSTIMHADRIYVLEKGKIIETGRHEDLLLEKGLYYAMWRQQIGERKTAYGEKVSS